MRLFDASRAFWTGDSALFAPVALLARDFLGEVLGAAAVVVVVSRGFVEAVMGEGAASAKPSRWTDADLPGVWGAFLVVSTLCGVGIFYISTNRCVSFSIESSCLDEYDGWVGDHVDLTDAMEM